MIDANGVPDVAALFFTKGALQLGGVVAIDENKIDLSVAFTTVLICLKRERERRNF